MKINPNEIFFDRSLFTMSAYVHYYDGQEVHKDPVPRDVHSSPAECFDMEAHYLAAVIHDTKATKIYINSDMDFILLDKIKENLRNTYSYNSDIQMEVI